MNMRDKIVAVADAYCLATSMSRSRLSTIVFSNGLRLDQIADDSDLTTGSYEKAMQWFSDNWPENTSWPKDIQRPVPSIVEAAE